MQGDPKVDELMRPVLAAIKRHVKNSDAITDIYNRAYEAVMNSMDVIDTSAKVAAKQIAESAKNLQRAEAAEARANKAEAYAKKLEEKIPETNLALAQTSLRAEAAEARAERLENELSEVVAYGGYYADIENRLPPEGQVVKVIASSTHGVDDFTVLRLDEKWYFASDPPREVTGEFEVIRIKPWDVKRFGASYDEEF